MIISVVNRSRNVNLDIVIMAAGKGTRMKSKLPKVLHKLAGRALLGHVLQTAAALKPRQVILITGHGAPEVIAYCEDSARATDQFPIKPVRQEPQLGTGHAVQQAVPELADDGLTTRQSYSQTPSRRRPVVTSRVDVPDRSR